MNNITTYLFDITKAQNSEELNEREKAVVRDSLRDYKQQTAIPRELATKIAKLSADAYDAWVRTKRRKNNRKQEKEMKEKKTRKEEKMINSGV